LDPRQGIHPLDLDLRIDPVALPQDQSAKVRDQPGAKRRADQLKKEKIREWRNEMA
jgi:hypothetical protein